MVKGKKVVSWDEQLEFSGVIYSRTRAYASVVKAAHPLENLIELFIVLLVVVPVAALLDTCLVPLELKRGKRLVE